MLKPRSRFTWEQKCFNNSPARSCNHDRVVFAERVIERYTTAGEMVLDPFAGRGTTVFSAAHEGRRGLGIELNPVGWVYARAKLQAADKADVLDRLDQIQKEAWRYRRCLKNLPEFFDHCFASSVCEFLVAA